MRSGKIRLCIVSRIYLRSFEGDGNTSQMEGYFSILLFSILLWHIGLQCLLVFYCYYYFFIIIFVIEVFERSSGEDSPQFCRFISVEPYNTLSVFRVETMWRLRENVVSELFRHGMHVECLQGPYWKFILHCCLLKTLTHFLCNKLTYYFY